MADTAAKDANNVSSLLGTSSVDGVSPVKVYANPTTHRLLTSNTTLSGPVSSTDTAIALWNGATGLVIQDSVVTINPTTGVFAGVSNIPYITSGAGAPGSTPGKIGDIYVDTSGLKIYISAATTNSGSWKILN